MGDLREARRAKAAQAKVRADRLVAAYVQTTSVSQAARVVGMSRQHASSVLRSRRVQEALRAAFVEAGITEGFLAQRLREMFDATKRVNVPDGAGGWTATREPDWRVQAEAFRLYLGTHERLMRLEADEAPDPDREVEEVVTETERASLTRTELFKLYYERLNRQRGR
jgi:hypothetical protein